MEFLVVGLGSMGKRRIRNLQYHKAGEIIGFDVREDRCHETKEKYGIKTFSHFHQAMLENPDVLIISTPPDSHHSYALKAAKNRKHFFTESNCISEGMQDLVEIEKKGEIVVVPSFTMPHHPSVKLIKKLVEEKKVGEILSFYYHLGGYLPDWHPWEDYREVYFSKKKTSGCREMVAFELTWLVWLLGKIKKAVAFKKKVSKLQIEGEDVYTIMVEFANGVLGTLLIEVFSPSSIREFKLLGEKGNIHWDSFMGKVRAFNGENKKWEEYPEEEGITEPEYSHRTHEEMYVEEIEDFLKALKGEKTYPYSFQKEKKIIDILEAVERNEGKTVIIEE